MHLLLVLNYYSIYKGANMLPTVQGIYRKGKVELTEPPPSAREESQVIVTFLEPGSIDLKSRGIDEKQAEELRAFFKPFTDDWLSPEMDVYDDYDDAKTKLPTR